MTAQTVQSGIAPESLLAALQALSPEQCQQVIDFAEFLVQKQKIYAMYNLKAALIPQPLLPKREKGSRAES